MINFNPGAPRATPFGDPSGSATTNPNVDPAGFASLLRQSQLPAAPAPAPSAPAPTSTAQPPAPAPPPSPTGNATPPARGEHAEASQAQDKAEQATQAESSQRARPAAKAKAKEGEPDAEPTTETPPAATADPAAGSGAAAAPPKAGKTATTADPGTMPWFAGLQMTPPSAAAAAPSGFARADPAGALGQAVAKRFGADARAEAALQAPSPSDPRSARDAAAFGELLPPTGGDTPTTMHGAAMGATKENGATGAVDGGFTATPTTGASAPASVAVAAPVNAPDFAQELGLHVSVLAKDGVQSAELHLNPADMGPVSVQIVMDGTQAHVAFGADMAATRQAIEAGLPQLAGALADAGFTLAGGGVSQHAGGGAGSGGGKDAGSSPGGRGRSVSAESTGRVAGAARRVVTQGGVDEFA